MFDLYGRDDVIYSFSCDTSQTLNRVYYSSLELFCRYRPNTDGHLKRIIFDFILFKKKKKRSLLRNIQYSKRFLFWFRQYNSCCGKSCHRSRVWREKQSRICVRIFFFSVFPHDREFSKIFVFTFNNTGRWKKNTRYKTALLGSRNLHKRIWHPSKSIVFARRKLCIYIWFLFLVNETDSGGTSKAFV